MSTDKATTSKSTTRRRFVLAAGATGAAAVAMPQVSRAQTVTWKYQSTWPTKDIFHEFAVDYAKKVNDMTRRPAPARRARRRRRRAGVPDVRRGACRRARCRSRRLRLLVRQAQGLFAVRHASVLGLGRAEHARLVLCRRRRSALQRARQRDPQAEPHRLPLLPDADPAARMVQERAQESPISSRA